VRFHALDSSIGEIPPLVFDQIYLKIYQYFLCLTNCSRFIMKLPINIDTLCCKVG
jgi:hypothetical protein